MTAWSFQHLNTYERERERERERARLTLLLAQWWHLCLDALDGQTLQPKTTDQGRKNSQLQDLQGKEGGGKCLWSRLVSHFRVLLGTMGKRPRVVRDIVFICVVLHNMLRTHQGRTDRAPTPGSDVAAQQNGQEVYVTNENYRNPLREAKHQRELLKCYFNYVGALAGQEDRFWDVNRPSWGQKLASISPFLDFYQSFLGLTNYSKNFYFSWCC